MESPLLTPEKLAQIKSVLNEIDISSSNSSIIQDNKILFPLNAKIYRVRMPNQQEEYLAEQAQNKLQVQLVQQEGTITRKKLITILKEKQDVDINSLEIKKEKLRKELQDIYLELAVVSSEDFAKIENLRLKKQEIESQFMDITIEIIEMLKPCIEEQIKVEYYRFLSYLCTEVQVMEDVFEHAWKNYNEYLKDDSGLTHKAIVYTHSLLINIKE